MSDDVKKFEFSTLNPYVKKLICEQLQRSSVCNRLVPYDVGMSLGNAYLKQMHEEYVLPMGLIIPNCSIHSPIYTTVGAGMSPGNSIIIDKICKPGPPLGYGTENIFSVPELIEQLLHSSREDEEARRSALLFDFAKCKKTTITLKNELSYGAKCYRVEKIRNVKKYDDLPRKYKTGRNYYYTPYDKPNSVDLWSDEAPYCFTLKEGELISEEMKCWVFRCINKSVKAYKECEREIRKLKMNWDGKEVEYKIG